MGVDIEELMEGLRKEGKLPTADTPKTRGKTDENRLQEYAINALNTLRGMSRADKIKVINRMRKILDA